MLRSHILVSICVPLILLAVLVSYYRFYVAYDYIADYEIPCEPGTQNCFVRCDTDMCTDAVPFIRVSKYALDLYLQCGANIEGCAAAGTCLQTDRQCSVHFCDSESLLEGESCASAPHSNQSTL